MKRIFITEAQSRMVSNVSSPISSIMLNGMRDKSVYAPLMDDIFAEKLLSDGYTLSKEAFKDDISSIPTDKVINEFNKLVSICTKKEQAIRPQLEQLCYNLVVEAFNIPEETIKMDIELVEQVNPSHIFHITAGTEENREYDSVESINNEEKEIDKRKLINVIIQGAADSIFENCLKKSFAEVFELDEELPHLYSKLIKLNTYLLYVQNVVIDDNNHCQAGHVEVNIGSDLRANGLKVEAVNFPILLNETIKGLLEIVASNGLPDNFDTAKNVIDNSDVLIQEPWNMRFGLPLWDRILSGKKIPSEDIPQFIDIIVKADPDSLFDLFNEILHSTKKGKEIISNIIDSVRDDAEYKQFMDDMMQKHTEKQVIDEIEFERV